MNAKKELDKKNRLDLIPPEWNWLVGMVLTMGANKYGARDWEKGQEYSNLYGAALRHITKWALGETNDSESGLPHLIHAVTNLAMIITYQERGVGINDVQKIKSELL